MKGLDLAQQFFEICGMPVLQEQFPDLLPYLAAGLFGMGSECFGYDDEVSQDHDFEPAFCLFLPEEALVDRRKEFLLERAYAKLPREFCGFKREVLMPVGGARHGVFRTAEFFQKMLGTEDGRLSLLEWLAIPENALAEATNGRVFYDGFGELSRIRATVSYYPEDVRLKRLAGHLLLMEQAGQYNYMRCIRHGEPEAAQMAVFEFVRSALSAVFLLNRVYQPYYKWSFRALRQLGELNRLSDSFSYLISVGSDKEDITQKELRIEFVCSEVRAALSDQGLSFLKDEDLERHAYAVNDSIRDSQLRNMHILAAV
ncbi:MAG: DUF4037 domain-containing protein [Oscillospiraceae bacterium]|nr:DUF4037 domain-containing protein [Oscillospiraceae bacterium]